jgi:carboxymethylenebutenolidase
VLRDLGATVDHLHGHAATQVATLGLSVGGHIAYLAAAELPLQAAVILYGGWLPTTDIALSRPQPTLSLTPRAPVLYLVGEHDHVVPPDHRRQIAAALQAGGDQHQLIEYPGVAHGFLNRRRESYDEQAARDVWTRIDSFYRAHRG